MITFEIMRNFQTMKQNKHFVHETALVETKNIGKDTRIWAFVHILPGAVIGENCNICDHCFIENDVILGDNVTVKCGIYLWDGIRVEDEAFLGPNVVFTNDLEPRSKIYPDSLLKTYVRKGASIGANATILPGIEIGEFALVGAGSVVTKDVLSHGLYYGNPAKFKGYVCECTHKIQFRNSTATCEHCGITYELSQTSRILKIKS